MDKDHCSEEWCRCAAFNEYRCFNITLIVQTRCADILSVIENLSPTEGSPGNIFWQTLSSNPRFSNFVAFGIPTQRQVGQFSNARVAVDGVVKARDHTSGVGHAVT